MPEGGGGVGGNIQYVSYVQLIYKNCLDLKLVTIMLKMHSVMLRFDNKTEKGENTCK